MPAYREMAKKDLEIIRDELKEKYEQYKERHLHLDMSRGKPGIDQLNMVSPLVDTIKSSDSFLSKTRTDVRNYGDLLGIKEARELMGEILEAPAEQVIVGGNSSLNMMYDTIGRALLLGLLGSQKPWSAYNKPKFLCPSPGYDRHFGICEHFGIEMITVPMTPTGPDMNVVEKLVSADESIKGIWCIPKYSNPQGYTYSDLTVKRMAKLKPAAPDFRIFWDNAYGVHHLTDQPDKLLNILEECKKAGNPNMALVFGSTSKITFPGSGIAAMASSLENIKFTEKQIFYQTIGPDKLNQFVHVKYLKNKKNVEALMREHARILKPKFNTVINILKKELGGLEIASWHTPNGGYFISVDVDRGCAKKVVRLCAEAGVKFTPAGATFPYGKDPQDSNIRLAPTVPPIEELEDAMLLFCICVKLAAIESYLSA